ncbi:MAG TPA: Wzy polymerase domain-containing protein [Burkholderiales bacterium]|nr:Wzy polymerase domain-containing protein [Burkholderiales bacterium]
MADREGRPLHVSLLLAGAMCLLPFLVPYHQPPIPSFYPEWLAAALGVCAALAALVRRATLAGSPPAPSLWLAALALYFLARASAGQAYPQIGLLAACYAAFAALMMWLGARLATSLGTERVALVLSACLLAGALANALAGAIQFYGRPILLEDAVALLSGPRAYGNIAQPNLYANYLALGQCALLFLWFRRRIRTPHALALAVALAAGSALSASRSALLFAAWIGLVGMLAGHRHPGPDARRLKLGAFAVAACIFAAHFGVPSANEAFHSARARESAYDRLAVFSAQAVEPRREIYAIGGGVFATAPVFGVGLGAFPGAAFDRGLDPSLTPSGEVLTSPHNLLLHLLAETGIVGALLCLAALGIWGWRLGRRYVSDPQPALWWIVAAVGIELIHSLVEFPLWSADFLGVAALLMGVGLPLGASSRSAAGAAGICGLLLVVLALLLSDYSRLDATRITGSAVTLARPADAQRDAATLRAVGHGLLAPVAELWIVLGTPVDRSDLAAKAAMSGRVATFWPSEDVVVRRAVFLALKGDTDDARVLLDRALRTFPQRRAAAIATIEDASHADAAALRPLLAVARGARADDTAK